MPVIDVLQRTEPDLARQLKRAAASITLNLAEGAQRDGKDRLQLYRMASGSNAEVEAVIRLASTWRLVPPTLVAPVDTILDRLRALFWRLLEANRRNRGRT